MKRWIAAVLVAGLMAFAPPAQAEDHRPCVSTREFRGQKLIGPVTRRDMETRWEVRGLGHQVSGDPQPAWDYPACGFSMDEVTVSIVTQPQGNLRVSTLDLLIVATMRWRSTTAGLPHGRP
jgi:hypothetical protein